MESEEIGILSVKKFEDGAFVAMFILDGGVWAVEEDAGEVEDDEVLGGAVEFIVLGEAFFDDCHSHSRGGGAFDEGDGYDGDGESSWGDRELEVVVGGSVICCVEDVMFELTADGVVGEDEGEEGGWCVGWPVEIFSKALDTHEAREADDAAEREVVSPVDADTHDDSDCHVDTMGEVVGAADVCLEIHPFVVKGHDERGDRGTD